MDELDELLSNFISNGYEEVGIDPSSTMFSGGQVSNADIEKLISGGDAYSVYDDIGINPSTLSSGGQASNADIQRLISGGASVPQASLSGGLDSIGKFVDNNKGLLNLAAGALSNASKAQQSREAVEKQEAIKAETRKRINDSIVGMGERKPGLIGHMTRMNGSRVYKDDGSIA